MSLKELKDELFEATPYRRAYAIEDLIHRVAERVLVYRQKRGLTQAELARETEQTQPRIAEIEGGFVNMTLRTLAKLAFALDCRPEDLVMRDSSVARLQGWDEKAPKASLFSDFEVLIQSSEMDAAQADGFGKAA